MVEFSVNIYDIYKNGLGEADNSGDALTAVKNCTSPAAAFACLSAYFAGLEQAEMNTLMDDYKDQHEVYAKCLTMSKFANEQKAEAAAAGDNGTSSWVMTPNEEEGVSGWSYKNYMEGILNDSEDGLFELDQKSTNYLDKAVFTQDEWESQCDIINQQKDIESSELNQLSTDMELAVQDSSEAQEMAANAIKKLSDLASSQAKTSGG